MSEPIHASVKQPNLTHELSLVGARRTEVVQHIEAFAAWHGRVVDKIARAAALF